MSARHLSLLQGRPIMNRALTNNIGMKLGWIPPGTFLMGSPDGEGSSDEHPQHEVEISRGFYMGVFPVTQQEYHEVMQANPSCFSLSGDGKHHVAGTDTGQFPVEQVSWQDALEFCRRLSDMDAKTYGLPTE